MKALEKILKKYEIQLLNLKENKIIDKSDIKYPYDFDIKRTKGFIDDLRRVMAKVVNTESKLNIPIVSPSEGIERRELLIAEKLQEHFDKYPADKFGIDYKVLARVAINCG
jgi:hypothetical protein